MKIRSKIAHLIKRSKRRRGTPKGSECFMVCLEKNDSSDKQTAKVYLDLKENSTLKQILPALVEDVIKQTR